MENWLLYIGKSALAAGAFYLAFLVLFQNGKQFVFNRIYLPVSFALSFIIPLITFTTINYVEPAAPVSSGYSFLPETIPPAEIVRPSFSFEWYHYLFGIYILGTTGFLFHLLTGHFNALQIIRKSRMMRLFTHWVHVTAKDIHPFSFFNSIVLSEKTLSNPNLRLIVTHEKIHVQEKHTLDILLAEILFLLQWFNPFAWLIKDAVKNNLEYKTDEQVAKTTDAKTYQLAMVALADKKGVAPFLTAMNGSQLKNRIIMMKKKTENRYAWLKQLVVLPLLAVLVMGLANREVKTEFISYGEQIENHSKYDFSKMKIVVDGEMIPTNSPELKNIELTKENNYNGRIVIDIIEALNINLEDIKTQAFSDNSENPYLYIRTKNYVPGNNKEFDEKTEPATMRAEILEKVLNKFLISIEFRQDQFILQGLEGCAFRELKFSANDKKPVAINRFGMSTEKIDNSPNDSGFLFEIEKTNDQINLTGNVGTTWKEISFNPASQKWFISETGVSRVNEPLIVVDGTITGYKSVDDINQAEIRSINVLEEEKAAEIYGEKGKNGVVLITTKNAKDMEKISGKVTDKNGEPIESASVTVKGRNFGVVTDKNGEYKIEVLKTDEVLVYGYLYHEKIEIEVGRQRRIDVQLNTDGEPPFSGVPLHSSFRMRNSRGELVKPLYLVDEKEVKIEDINWNYVESYKIMNDKTAPEIYGEKGKNGVVQIETKKENKPDINPGAGRVEIKGKVISGQDSKPIPGATVLFTANNKQLGTITNVNGEFLLQTDSQNVQLEFYSEGYLKKKMDWDGSKELVVMLEPDKNAIIPDRSANALKWEKMLRKAGIEKYPKGEEPIVIQDGYETLYNANDIAGLYNPDIIKNINYSKKTNIEIKRKELARNGFIEIKTTLPRQDKKLYIIDGEEVFMKNQRPSVYIYPKQLQMMKGLSKEEAVKKYGAKAKHGAVEITTKSNDDMSETDVSRVNDPLIVIDGIITGYKSIDHINPGDILSITVLKGKKATERYGDKGNNGVLEVTMKPVGIYTELQFGRYIANEVRYPVLAQKSNLEKMVHLSVKIDNDGRIEMISDDSIAADFSLDEVVVVSYKNQDNVVTGYPSKSAAEQAHKEKEQLFVDETKRVINRITKIDIDKFKGKTVGITVKFVLQ